MSSSSSSRVREHIQNNLVGYIAIFLFAVGGTAIAAHTAQKNSVTSKSIKDRQVRTRDIAPDAVTGRQAAESTLDTVPRAAHAVTADHAADAGSASDSDALGGQGPETFQQRVTGTCGSGRSVQAVNADGSVSCGGDVVQGSGTLLSNRIAFAPFGGTKTLLTIPGLGRLEAICQPATSHVEWENDTGSTIDYWVQVLSDNPAVEDRFDAGQASAGEARTVTLDRGRTGTVLSLGGGSDPGARHVATINVFSFQSADDAPCAFQAQGTLWASG